MHVDIHVALCQINAVKRVIGLECHAEEYPVLLFGCEVDFWDLYSKSKLKWLKLNLILFFAHSQS